MTKFNELWARLVRNFNGCGSYSERKHNSRRCAAMSGSGLRARYSEEEGIDSLAAAQLEKVRSQLSTALASDRLELAS